ncbi:hypothetical protein RF11_06571 [Thelohanellus kitauei]|uniref:Uncharacterized protein n=1 Tax=Thelohanellus kitauei TaxID=669202 RepID=A0A0C2MJP4_THEKT|nr:hypothetical protein RF11_06571 [Thelohanellus kitauei]
MSNKKSIKVLVFLFFISPGLGSSLVEPIEDFRTHYPISRPVSHEKLTKLAKLCHQASVILENGDMCSSKDLTSLALNQYHEVDVDYIHGKCFLEQVNDFLTEALADISQQTVGNPGSHVGHDQRMSTNISNSDSISDNGEQMSTTHAARRPISPDRETRNEQSHSQINGGNKTPSK